MTTGLRGIGRLRGWLNTGLYAIAAVVLTAMMLLTVLDVIGTKLGRPISGTFEIIEMLVALVVFAAFPITTGNNAHLTVPLFTDRLTGGSKRVHRIAIQLVNGLAVWIIAARLWHKGDRFSQNGDMTGYLEIPLAPLAYAMGALAWLALAMVALNIVLLVTGGSVTGGSVPDEGEETEMEAE